MRINFIKSNRNLFMENQTFTCWLQWLTLGRALWPCGLIRHVLDQEIRGSNLSGGSQNFSYFRIEERALVQEARRNGMLRKMMPRIIWLDSTSLCGRQSNNRKAEEISRFHRMDV